MSILSRSRYGLRLIQAPLGQKVPTLEDVKVLTTSGTLPLRIAAMILLSTMSPTTLTFTSGCFESYSATSRLNALSSWVAALQPTQTLIVTGFDAVALSDSLESPPPKQPVSGRVAASRAHTIATRLMRASLVERYVWLVRVPYEMRL